MADPPRQVRGSRQWRLVEEQPCAHQVGEDRAKPPLRTGKDLVGGEMLVCMSRERWLFVLSRRNNTKDQASPSVLLSHSQAWQEPTQQRQSVGGLQDPQSELRQPARVAAQTQHTLPCAS